jgi:peptidoglycan-associated lipoprotein
MKNQLILSVAAAAFCLTVSGCHKKIAAAKPPTPPPPAVASSPAPAAETRTPEPSRPAEVAATPRSAMPDAQTKARIQELLDRIQDAYFDYNQHSLRPDAETALKQDVQTLSEIIRQYPDFRLTIEGYCDERGSDEYNLALGEARAKQAKEYMAGLGLPSDQLKTVSYGKEKAICTEHDETCWQKNRRAHITQAQ